MNKQPGSASKFVRAVIFASLPLFAACGGGEEDEETGNKPGSGFNDYQTCLSWTEYYEDPAACQSGGQATGSGGSTPPPSAPPQSSENTSPPQSGSGISALINDEMEPNDTVANANVMSYPTRGGSVSRIGWVAAGSISDSNDTVDYFSFTAPASWKYTLRLCPPSGSLCGSTTGPDTLTVYFDVLDQDGNVLLSSQASDTNAHEMAIDAGVIYYVRVVAGDTMGAEVDYDFQAFEWN